MSKLSAFQLIQAGAKFIRFTSGDENNQFLGSYWEKQGGGVVQSDERFNPDTVSELIKQTGMAQSVSDGYHTFGELYDHRCALFAALCNMMPDNCFKAKKNRDGEEWEGWFILVCDHPIVGQMSYHLPLLLWDNCRVTVRESNNIYDGHSSMDVLHRLSRI